MEIHTNIKFLFFSKAFLVPKQRLNKKKKTQIQTIHFLNFLGNQTKPKNYISKKDKKIKKKKGCTIPEEIDGGDVAMLALGRWPEAAA